MHKVVSTAIYQSFIGINVLFSILGHFALPTMIWIFLEISVDGLSIPEEERTAYEWLQEKEKPENLKVVVKMYSGPKIVEN